MFVGGPGGRRLLAFVSATCPICERLLPSLPAAADGLSAAFSAVGLLAAGDRVFATDSQSGVRVARKKADGSYAWEGAFVLKAPAVGGAA